MTMLALINYLHHVMESLNVISPPPLSPLSILIMNPRNDLLLIENTSGWAVSSLCFATPRKECLRPTLFLN